MISNSCVRLESHGALPDISRPAFRAQLVPGQLLFDADRAGRVRRETPRESLETVSFRAVNVSRRVLRLCVRCGSRGSMSCLPEPGSGSGETDDSAGLQIILGIILGAQS